MIIRLGSEETLVIICLDTLKMILRYLFKIFFVVTKIRPLNFKGLERLIGNFWLDILEKIGINLLVAPSLASVRVYAKVFV